MPLSADILLQEDDLVVLSTEEECYPVRVKGIICPQESEGVLINQLGSTYMYFYTGKYYMYGKRISLTNSLKRRIVAHKL